MKTAICTLLVISFLAITGSSFAASIDIGHAIPATDNSGYDRNPSITYDGVNYWLFYAKGDNGGTRGVAGYDPDGDTYVVYYKSASSIAGLSSATETKLGLSETSRPADFTQRVVSAVPFGGGMYAFVSSGQDGTNRGLYYYFHNGTSWSGPTELIADATARGGHVNVSTNDSYIYIVWESSDGSSDCYTWDETTLSSKIDISNGNQPKIVFKNLTAKAGGNLYVVNVEDGTGDIEIFFAEAGASPLFASHSTAIPGSGLYDPCIFTDGTDLYVISAPYVGAEDRQYLVQTVFDNGTATWSAAKTISYGGYRTTKWWDYWPCGYHDGTNAYVFFTSESDNGPSYGDGEIAYITLDWDLSHDHYLFIQNGVDLAAPGDEINVSAGTYFETLNITTTGLQIVGADRTTVVIDPTGLATNNAGIYVNANNVTLQSLTLQSTVTSSLPRYGIKFGTVDGCTLQDVTARDSYRSGIDALGTSNLTVSNVSSLDNGGHGLSLVDCNTVAVTDITLSGNGWQNVSVATWGRYTPLGTSEIVFDGTNSFGDLFQLEMGDYNNPGVTPAGEAVITYSTNILDGADVTVQASDFSFALHGEQDDSPGQGRIWFFSTLTNAAIVPPLAPIGHWTGVGMYMESLTDATQLYATPGCDIQAAIDAADPGDDVNVLTGTYRQQLYIDHSVNLVGDGAGLSIIEAPDPIDRTTYSVTQWTGSARIIDAIIGIVGAGTVNINGFTVDGRDVGPNNFYGIHFFDTDGSVTYCTIDNITDAAAPSNSRVASLVATHGLAQSFTIDFSNNSIPVFQKGGILLMGPGASFTVNHNSVTNEPSPVLAGNGIQLSYGASGSTLENIVAGTIYSGDDWAATGILLFESGDISMVGDEVYNCQSGVNFSDWGWVHLQPVPVNLSFTDLNLHENEWTLGIQLSRDNSDVNMTVTNCDILNSTGDGIDLYCTGVDPWGGSYYTGWNNGDLAVDISNCYISGTTLDGIWGGDYSGNLTNNVTVSVSDCGFASNTGSAINNDFTQMLDASGCYWNDPSGPSIGAKSGGMRSIAPSVNPFGEKLPAKASSAYTELTSADKGSGEAVFGNVDYTPWVGTGAQTSPGFAGDFSTLYVDGISPQSGATGYIQEGVDLVDGSTVNVAAGTYTENITVDKYVEIIGAGSGTDPSSNTIITQNPAGAGDTKIGVIQLTASGNSDLSPTLFQDIRVAPDGMAGFSVGRFTESTGADISYIKLDNVVVVGNNVNPNTEQERGLYVDKTSSLRYLTIVNSAFDSLTYGWYLQKDVSADASTVEFVTVTGTSFNHNNHKGIYAEKLSEADFTDCVVSENGFSDVGMPSYFVPWMSGIDINLKAGTYQNLAFNNCTVTDNALGGAKEGVGLTVKGRGTGNNPSGSYVAFPAWVDNVTITGGTYTGNERGMRFGEPGKENASPTNVAIHDATILGNNQSYVGVDGSAYGGVINQMMAGVSVDATDDYWGTLHCLDIAASVSGEVDFDPWCDAGFSYCLFTCGGVAEVWVDDDWIGSSEGDEVSTGLYFGYNAFDVVQDGVDGVSIGGIVHILAGSYTEQVHITKDNLSIIGAGVDDVFIVSPVSLIEFFVTTTNNNYPVVFIDGAEGTSVSDLTVDGDNQGGTNYRFIGVGLWNAGGTLINLKVLNVMNSTFSGAQHGVGIYSYNNTGGPYTITLNTVLIDDFQKTAVALLGSGLTVDLDDVTTPGEGPTAVTAQNGIQIGEGVLGTIDNCSMSLIDYTGATWTATGFLNYGNIVATGLVIDQCQTSVYWTNGTGSFDGGMITNPTGDAFYAYNASASKSAKSKVEPQPFEEGIVKGFNVKTVMTVTVSNSTITGAGATDSWGVSAFSTSADAVNLNVANCFISNWDYALFAYDYGGPVNLIASGNSITSSTFAFGSNMSNRQDGSGNWLGTNDPAAVLALFDGDIDFSPWLDADSDISGDAGFQGDFSTIWIDNDSPQMGGIDYAADGLSMVTGATPTIIVAPGTYNETIALTPGFDDGTITAGSDVLPIFSGGLTFSDASTGMTIRKLHLKGPTPSHNTVIRTSGVVSNLTVDSCVIDGENITGRNGYTGGEIHGDATFIYNDILNILGWAVLDSRSGSGGDGSPMGTVTFANNHIHECNGSIVFRGLSTDWTDVVDVYGNNWENIGGNQSEQGQHWAAFEINRANDVNVYDNTVDGVVLGQWDEGQAAQLWDITDLDLHNNTFTNCAQGIFIFGGGGTVAVPGGSIYDNDISGNDQYGLMVDPTATGGPLDAACNWWGDITGPNNDPDNLLGLGNSVSDNVTFEPWSNQSFSQCIYTANPSEVWVDDNYYDGGANDSHTWQYDAFDVVQEAINFVADGGTVHILAGTFTEQLRIDGKDLIIDGAGIGQSIIEAVPTGDRTSYEITQWTGSVRTIDACIGVTGAGNVNISGLTVDGLGLGPNNFYGIHFFNSGGSVTGCRIEDVTNTAAPSQSRIVSLVATHGVGETLTIDFSNNVVPNFQKGGILIMGPGVTFTMNNNTVDGAINASLAPNGIQVSYGCAGTLTNNNVTGVGYSGDDWAGTGILLFETEDITVTGGNVIGNQVGIGHSQWDWVYTPTSTPTIIIDDVSLDNNDWSIETHLGADGDGIILEIKNCTIANSQTMGVDLWGSDIDPWGGSYYPGWTNGTMDVNIYNNSFVGGANGFQENIELSTGNSVNCAINGNSFSGFTGQAVINEFTNLIDASGNWWNDISGPSVSTKSNSVTIKKSLAVPYSPSDELSATSVEVSHRVESAEKGIGESITANVDYSPWWGHDYLGDAHTSGWLWMVDQSNGSSIQEGIDAASETQADSVIITDDVYAGGISFLGKGIVVSSYTALDGDPAHIAATVLADYSLSGSADTGSVVRFVNGETSASILQNVMIRGGVGTVDATMNRRGGGILCDGSSPIIRNCVVHLNSAARGGAVACVNANPTISQCTFDQNSAAAGGGLYCDNASPVISNSIISYSTEGEAVYCVGGSTAPVFTNMNIYGNTDGNYVGCIAAIAGVDGNMSFNPTYCETGVDYGLDALSPCAASHPLNLSGTLIGAFDVTCTNCTDNDGDLICDTFDNCATVANLDQADMDEDGVGDACDNCPATYNPDQADDNGNNIGDLCEYAVECGDANGDDKVNVGDAVFLINYVFKGGPGPEPVCRGNSNGDAKLNVGDAVYLINFVFKGGPAPIEPCCPLK